MDAEDLVVEQFVQASAETVFSFFTDPERWLQWQGVDGTVEARPGGALRMEMAGGSAAAGHFVEVEPPHRVVFTWGWEGGLHGLPPGTSTVEVELIPQDGGTLVRLTHRDLPNQALRDDHREGWAAYLARLAAVAEGRDPGPDPMAA
ncbi:MAG TPA: SRPBCC domain-containing protein [Candidatus Angelobacter sp.]|nr:SRPBCC domain-containing protein [Candidatus Angelobacter sp.]